MSFTTLRDGILSFILFCCAAVRSAISSCRAKLTTTVSDTNHVEAQPGELNGSGRSATPLLDDLDYAGTAFTQSIDDPAAHSVKEVALGPHSLLPLPQDNNAAGRRLVPRGERHHFLFTLARACRENEMRDAVPAILKVINAEYCDPPKRDRELERIVNWSGRESLIATDSFRSQHHSVPLCVFR